MSRFIRGRARALPALFIWAAITRGQVLLPLSSMALFDILFTDAEIPACARATEIRLR